MKTSSELSSSCIEKIPNNANRINSWQHRSLLTGKEVTTRNSCIPVVSPLYPTYIGDASIIELRKKMEFSPNTTSLLQQLELLSGKKLSHENEVALLIELAHQHNKLSTLDDLSFFAKFAHRAFGMMRRIGKNADGYDKLSKEFGESVEKSKNLLNELLGFASDDERKKFSSLFLVLSPSSLENLLTLFYDLSWYKNFLIDSRKR